MLAFAVSASPVGLAAFVVVTSVQAAKTRAQEIAHLNAKQESFAMNAICDSVDLAVLACEALGTSESESSCQAPPGNL